MTTTRWKVELLGVHKRPVIFAENAPEENWIAEPFDSGIGEQIVREHNAFQELLDKASRFDSLKTELYSGLRQRNLFVQKSGSDGERITNAYCGALNKKDEIIAGLVEIAEEMLKHPGLLTKEFERKAQAALRAAKEGG